MTSYGFAKVHGCLSLDTEAQCGFAMRVMVGDDYKQCVSYLSSDCNWSSHYTPDTNFEDINYQGLCDQVSASTLSHIHLQLCMAFAFVIYFVSILRFKIIPCCIIFSHFHKGRLDSDRHQGQCKR